MKYMLLLLISFSVIADDHSSATEDKIKEALKSDIRTEAETKRDRNRMPVSTLKFFGLEHDMTVIELIPGGGWYTKVLAPVLRDEGELIGCFRYWPSI